MLDSLTLPAWAASIFDHLQGCNFAQIALVILNDETSGVQGSAPTKRGSLLYNLYSNWDTRRFKKTNDPLAPVDCGARLKAAPIVSIKPSDEGSAFSLQDVEAVRAHNLDIILKLGFHVLRGEILEAARYGVWAFNYGESAYGETPPYFWEIHDARPLSSVSLTVLDRDPEKSFILCDAALETQQGVSVARNRVQPLWTASLFVIRKLHELHEHGWESLLEHSPGRLLTAPKREMPGNRTTARFLFNWAFRRGLPNRLRPEPMAYWRVGLHAGAGSLSIDRPEPRDFRWLNEPRGHYYADPFLIEKNGKMWLFAEDYSYREGIGTIASAEVTPDGKVSNFQTVLASGYHLSYPLVFEHAGEMYMIPESAANKTVDLYRADPFPDRWRLEKTLLANAKGTDTTLWIEDGTFWFFVTLRDPPGAGPQLFLFYAASLTGDWTYHPRNPICSDVQFARGAGRIFLDAGRRIRPSQDHSRGYGCALHFREILALSKTSYREVSLGSIEPTFEPGLTGVHTYNRCGQIEVIDANRPQPLARPR